MSKDSCCQSSRPEFYLPDSCGGRRESAPENRPLTSTATQRNKWKLILTVLDTVFFKQMRPEWMGQNTGEPAEGVLTPCSCRRTRVRSRASQGEWPEERAGSGTRADWPALRAREQEHVLELRPVPCPGCACARATRCTALFQRLLYSCLAPRGGNVEGRGLASGALVTSRDSLAPCHSSLGPRLGRNAVCIPGTLASPARRGSRAAAGTLRSPSDCRSVSPVPKQKSRLNAILQILRRVLVTNGSGRWTPRL